MKVKEWLRMVQQWAQNSKKPFILIILAQTKKDEISRFDYKK